MKMKILCITHADFESPGVIEFWAKAKSYHFHLCKPYKNEPIPAIEDYQMLIVMGGPQSPLHIDKAPYLHHEIQTIQDALTLNKPILGFCLGAQLIGEALAAKTEKSPFKEVGVFPITLTKEGTRDPLLAGLPIQFPVIHWHNDMPGLTIDAQILAFSEGCPRQIVRYQPCVYGFQCHLEITREGIQIMVQAVPEDLSPSPFTQTKADLMIQNYDSINDLMITLLDRLVEISREKLEI